MGQNLKLNEVKRLIQTKERLFLSLLSGLCVAIQLITWYYYSIQEGAGAQANLTTQRAITRDFTVLRLAVHLGQIWDRQTRSTTRIAMPSQNISMDVIHALNTSKLHLDSELCLASYSWNGFKLFVNDHLDLNCNGSTFMVKTHRRRIEIYSSVFEYCLHQLNLGPFSWVLDVSDATRNYQDFFHNVQAPFMAFAKSKIDNHTLPIPDPHMVQAMMWEMGAVPRRNEIAVKKLKKFYAPPRGSSQRWSDKKNVAVYRGTCNPTINPQDTTGFSRIYPRSEVCVLYGNDDRFDIGIDQGDVCLQWHTTEFCQQCMSCNNKTRLGPSEMSSYKYLLAVDGHGPSYDATIWQLLSKSVVFLVEHSSGVAFDMFYYPLLRPRIHYVPTNVRQLKSNIQWCEDHDAESKRIAERAHELTAKIIDPVFVTQYMKEILKIAHKRQNGR